ncbi:hypothetical protein PARHAE_01771 [Paracoccus haematequi]|uniref:Uncharacterized protein n=1 Tax=Paracoccus haematequi TaxID=2491866 RepID=A0A447IM47_9RHOB|nr:hypothetical protein [Paracoccus haematequi]VDS08587.1 hypothetical protein PARHAE_01771 [Paracoccus haematequi]
MTARPSPGCCTPDSTQAPRNPPWSWSTGSKRAADWSQTAEVHEDPAVLQAALQGSGLKPLDGVVAERPARITQGAITDRQKVAPVNAALHGNWEGNRMAFNTASDLSPPGAEGALPFLMYPQGLTGQGRLDEPDPKAFAYEMTAAAV